jgi:YVTN family beta-propeller protein
VTPIDVATGRAGTPIQVGKGPVAIAITPDGKTAYVASYKASTVTPIDVATGRAGTPITVGNSPLAIAITS